jgi:hypothetical protein
MSLTNFVGIPNSIRMLYSTSLLTESFYICWSIFFTLSLSNKFLAYDYNQLQNMKPLLSSVINIDELNALSISMIGLNFVGFPAIVPTDIL